MGTGGPCAIVTPTFSFSLFICQLKCKTLLRFCLPKSVFGIYVGIDLFSRTVASQVSSAPHSLTSVFGMGTGGPCAIVTPTVVHLRRLELRTHWLRVSCSTNWARGASVFRCAFKCFTKCSLKTEQRKNIKNTAFLCIQQSIDWDNRYKVVQAFGLLVSVSWMHYCTYTSDLSNS